MAVTQYGQEKMTPTWYAAESNATGYLFLNSHSDPSRAIESINSDSELLFGCLTQLPDIRPSEPIGLYAVINGDYHRSQSLRMNPLNYFKNMPGLLAPFAMNQTQCATNSGPTFTFLGVQYGFLHAIDQLLYDFSRQRVTLGIICHAQTHSVDSGYGIAILVRSPLWLKTIRKKFLSAFDASYDNLIERFELRPIKTEGAL